MFQYAVGRSISLRLGTVLKLDTADFCGYELHQGFELNKLFNCNVKVATDADLKIVLGWQRAKLTRKILSGCPLKRFKYSAHVVEPHFNYWNGIIELKDDVYLDGYWQSEKYFQNYKDLIRNEFSFKLPLSKKNSEFSEQISMTSSVGLHVRRGDYANNPKTAAMHGLCSVDYYNMAIQYIANQIEKPYFYIFSDDVNWARGNIKFDYPHQYVNHNTGSESYNDMRLMSLCKHNIIANSSFSWWSAWLNANPTKIVIAPNKWFAKNVDTTDLIPSSWVKI